MLKGAMAWKPMMAAMSLTALAVEDITGMTGSTAERVLTQGGLLAVTLVLLFFYRKDFLGVFKRQEDTLQAFNQTLVSFTAASVKIGMDAAFIEREMERNRAELAAARSDIAGLRSAVTDVLQEVSDKR